MSRNRSGFDIILTKTFHVGDVIKADETWRIMRLGPEAFSGTVSDNGTIHYDGHVLIAGGQFEPDVQVLAPDDHCLHPEDKKADIAERALEAGLYLRGMHFIVTHAAGNPIASIDDVPKHHYNPAPLRDGSRWISTPFQASCCTESGELLGKMRILFDAATVENPHGLSTQNIVRHYPVVRSFAAEPSWKR